MSPKKLKKSSGNAIEPDCDEAKPVVANKNNESFATFEFDERLLKAIGEIGWEKPTHVQNAMIPLALEDTNIIARGRTGSGKTAAFLLPIIQKILQLSSTCKDVDGTLALIIAPTKELASQIYSFVVKLTSSIPFLQSINFAQHDEANEDVLNDAYDIIVSTPSRLLCVVKRNPNLLEHVRYVVLDEADLLFSFGYRTEMSKIKELLPDHYQTIMTSATLDEDLTELRSLFTVGKVATLKLKEGKLPSASQLSQYHIFCSTTEERFTILLVMLKLKLLVGKSVIFVSTTDRCYKLSLFLDIFRIKSCILNSQMPANYRCQIIHEFNEGKYPYIIASESNEIFDESEELDEQKQVHNKKKFQRIKKNKQVDKESGVGRGIDFNFVSNVINFDFPTSTDMYIHRVGRTARGWNKGTAISLVGPEERKTFRCIQEEINSQMGYAALKPYEIRMEDFESFQLRAREVLAACTKSAIREARLAEIRQELLKSKQLEAYFKKNPREKAALEQDKRKCKVNVYSEGIADVPEYMVPKALRGQDFSVPRPSRKNYNSKRTWKRKHAGETLTSNQKKFKKKAEDPLQSFEF